MHKILFFAAVALCFALGLAYPADLSTLEKEIRETVAPVNVDTETVSPGEGRDAAVPRSERSDGFQDPTAAPLASDDTTLAAATRGSDVTPVDQRDSDATTEAFDSRVPRSLEILGSMIPIARQVIDWKKQMIDQLGGNEGPQIQ
ncbi:uncharacterized protein LOC108679171 [Hyalella azteca]|uniref:Uncharacterized protein LOC108679171 n=1 Tax=Hyalella azteca TaxID=294128 RepID=A0A8B7PAS2_HYAAZ|nr:uncharacterized protein LOC108679171 [Hyalella azteca]